jgi:hypothetical protein
MRTLPYEEVEDVEYVQIKKKTNARYVCRECRQEFKFAFQAARHDGIHAAKELRTIANLSELSDYRHEYSSEIALLQTREGAERYLRSLGEHQKCGWTESGWYCSISYRDIDHRYGEDETFHEIMPVSGIREILREREEQIVRAHKALAELELAIGYPAV